MNKAKGWKCPLCDGNGKVYKMPIEIKQEKILKMHELGFSVREIMRALNYKSPRSVHSVIQGKTPRAIR